MEKNGSGQSLGQGGNSFAKKVNITYWINLIELGTAQDFGSVGGNRTG